MQPEGVVKWSGTSPSTLADPVKCDAIIDDVNASAFDALVIPGGLAAYYMRRGEKMLKFVEDMAASNKLVAAINHGPWLLCSAKRADGKPLANGIKATSYSAIRDDMVNAGVNFVDAPVVLDKPFVTARTSADVVVSRPLLISPAFACLASTLRNATQRTSNLCRRFVSHQPFVHTVIEQLSSGFEVTVA